MTITIREPGSAITHLIGMLLATIASVPLLVKAALTAGQTGLIAMTVFMTSMVLLYAASTMYHSVNVSGKRLKIFRKIDHMMIFVLIAGSYTPVVLSALRPVYPQIGWGLLAAQWILATLGATFTAIDLHRYRIFSMICYIGMGWGIILFLPQTIEVIGMLSFGLLLAGGIAYTIGAVLYGIGAKKHWMHSVFHIFVVIGTVFQFFAIFFAI